MELSSLILQNKSSVIAYPFNLESSGVSGILKEYLTKVGLPIHIVSDNFLLECKQFNMTTPSIYIFTSLRNALSIISELKFLQLFIRDNVLVFMTTFGIKQKDIDTLYSYLPSTKIYSASFISFGENICYELHKVLLNESQLVKCKTTGDIKYCNIDLRSKILSLRDSLSLNLYEMAPKMSELLSFLLLKSMENHVIVTNYSGYFGAKLIEAFSSRDGRKVFVIDGQSSLNDINTKVQSFNESIHTSPILITTSLFHSVFPIQIDHIHFLDTFNHTEQFIHQCYTSSSIGRFKNSLTVHFYVSNDPKEQDLYRTTSQILTEKIHLWDSLWSSPSIVLNGNSLVVN